MKLHYKKTGTECSGYRFNIQSLAEIDVGDDSVFTSNLDVWLKSKGVWKDLTLAFCDRDLIVDNHNVYFFEPKTEEDRQRGYTLT